MTKSSILVGAALLSLVTAVIAEEPAQKPNAEPEPTKATYALTGLHCRPCTKTVESSLQTAKGIHSIKVDWDTKMAHVEFDESVVPAQKVAGLIADTPHMMGSKMHYAGLLVLKVNEIRDDATAKPAKEALAKVKGVERVLAYPAQHSVEVQFTPKGDVTTTQLIEALKTAGMSATT